MHKMISVPTPSLLSSAVSLSFGPLEHIVSFLSVKEVGNLFFLEKSISKSIKDLVKCFSNQHTLFNTSLSTAVQTEHLTLMKGLDRSIRLFGPTSPRWSPRSTQLPAGFTLGGFGANYNEIAYSIGYLSRDPANSPILVAADVHIPLSELLRDPLATPLAKQWAALALANLSVEDANSQRLMDADVHIPLSALLSDLQATPLAKQWAAVALLNLSRDPVNRQPLVVDGVHNPLSALLSDQQATAEAKELAARALRNLSRDPVNSPILVAAGVHNQLSALLIDPQATPLAKQWAAGALENLEPTPRGFCVIS